MYLKNPIPLPVNSSPFFLLPKQQFHSSTDQLRFAAKIILFALDYKKKIDNHELTPDFIPSRGGKPTPLCMETYEHFFPAYRRPGEQKDDLIMSNQQGLEHSWNVVVACRNQFFSLQVKAANSEDFPSEDQLTDQLRQVTQMARDKENMQPPVGLLTTENRQTWAKIRNKMLKSPSNTQSLKTLEHCLLLMCLDESIPGVPNYSTIRKEATTLELAAMAGHVLHGSGTDAGTANRWYDKFLQAVVSRDGVVGFIVEHSASEGITVLRFCEEFLQKLSDEEPEIPPSNTNVTLRPPTTLSWEIDDEISTAIQEASKKMNKLCNDLDLFVHRFTKYGKDFIKNHKISPDAFIQVALQLTYYKVHRRLVSTYESASLRRFKHGRVDNIRAATPEALSWVKVMCDDQQVSEEEKVKLFQACIKKQTEIMIYTVNGEGPDNHLLALKELAKAKTGDDLPFFKDKSYFEYLNFRLSTSQLPTNYGVLVGYGPVVPDGYGCSYNPCSDHISFCVSSFFSSKETSSDFFAHSLEGSLLNMGEICLKMKQMEEDAKNCDQALQSKQTGRAD
ncbi:choline O-acetyltransferase-like [Uloborus diversus]|uniref:choline O-acetyltransferase-like n=1 Tax=Uloborus diversus TaxID=327109 RepID=UPI002409FF39|nr:choline O-acetyltransferase-like [Uloborus diversus]